MIASSTEPQITFKVTIQNLGRSPAIIHKITAHNAEINIVDGMTVEAGQVSNPRQLVVVGLSEIGEKFSGKIEYHSAVGGDQSLSFVGEIAIEKDPAASYYAIITRTWLPRDITNRWELLQPPNP